MMHAKTAVADGRWGRVGSTNLNIAGWFGNCELDAVVEGESFARQMEEMYLQDVTDATGVVLNPKARERAPGPQAADRYERRGKRRARGGRGGSYRKHGEVRLMASAGAVLLILAALFALFPYALAYPLLIVFVWLCIALLYRSYQWYREGRRKKKRA